MFDMMKNLSKATIAVAVTPITAVVDFVMWPADVDSGVAPRTLKKIDQAGKAFDAALKPEEKSS